MERDWWGQAACPGSSLQGLMPSPTGPLHLKHSWIYILGNDWLGFVIMVPWEGTLVNPPNPNWHLILLNHWLDECTAIKDYHIPLKGGMSHPRPSQVGLNSDGTSSFGVWMPIAKSMPLMVRMAMMTAKSLMNWRTWWGIYYLVFDSWNT